MSGLKITFVVSGPQMNFPVHPHVQAFKTLKVSLGGTHLIISKLFKKLRNSGMPD